MKEGINFLPKRIHGPPGAAQGGQRKCRPDGRGRDAGPHGSHVRFLCVCGTSTTYLHACIPMYAFPQRKLQVAPREPSSDCFWLPQRVTPPLFLKPTSVCNIDELEPSPLLCLCKQLYGDHVECACARSAV